MHFGSPNKQHNTPNLFIWRILYSIRKIMFPATSHLLTQYRPQKNL